MAKVKLRTTVLKGTNEKLKEKAAKYGLSLEGFFHMLANVDWYSLTKDWVMEKRIRRQPIPEELEFLDQPDLTPQELGKNTEPLKSVSVESEVERKLLILTHQYALRSLGELLDKVGHWPLQVCNPDLINGFKKGGKKK